VKILLDGWIANLSLDPKNHSTFVAQALLPVLDGS